MVTITNAVAQLLLAALFVYVLVTFWRSRDAQQGSVALVLGTLGGTVILDPVLHRLGWPPVRVALINASLLLLQPYLVLRLVAQFRTVPVAVRRAALVGLLASWALLWLHKTPLGAGEALIIAYFLSADGYTVWAFLRAAMAAGGIIRRRMAALALAQGFLTLALVVVVAVSWLGIAVADAPLLTSLLLLLSAAHFYFGFAPPRGLRRRWALGDVYAFTREFAALRDPDEALRRLAAHAIRISGGARAAVLMPDGEGRPTLRFPSGMAAPPTPVTGHEIFTPLWRAWRDSAPAIAVAGRNADVDAMLRMASAQALLSVPVRIAQRPFAVLLVFADRGWLFADDDLQLLASLAAQTAIVLENHHLSSESELRAHQLAALNQVGTALLRSFDAQTFQQDVLEVVVSATMTDVAELFTLAQDESGDLVRQAVVPRQEQPVRLRAGTGIPGEALRLREVVYSEDVRSDPRYLRQDEAQRGQYVSMLAVPLLAAGRPIGVLCLYGMSARAFRNEERTVIEAIAAQLATALDNRHLYRESRRRGEQLATLHETALMLTSELHMTDLLQKVADAALRLTQANEANVRLRGTGAERARSVDAKSAGGVREAPDRRTTTSLEVVIGQADEALGSITVTGRDATSRFSADDEQALQALAAQAAIAIQNAHLFEQTAATAKALRHTNAELERASHHKSEFLASMSHELRTPLNAILGFSEIMLDDAGRLEPERQQHYLQMVHDSGRHLLGLINDILDLSKVEAGRMELHLEPIDLGTVQREVLTTVQPLADKAGVLLERRDAVASVALQADRAKLKQILYNLLSNAIKFTLPGGRVWIASDAFAEEVVLTVSDTGVGIPQAQRERVFEEFYQLDAAAGGTRKGTGLGLALVRRFAELHGGRVWLQSEEGRGSHFHVALPLRIATSAPVDRTDRTLPPETADAAAPLILVVEDDPRAANLLCLLLRRGGYRTEVAAGGQEALEKARVLRPAAITLDIILPGTDGWEVLRLLKQDAATRDTPVVVVSIVDEPAMAYALGATDYFVKPIDRRMLLDRLGRYTFTTKVRRQTVTVLVVDDDPQALSLMSGILAAEGFRVLQAADGKTGVALAREQQPHLVLLDLVMPDMNGFQVLDTLRSDPRTSTLPVLVVTAQDLSAQDKAALSGQVLTILQKGAYSKQDLLAWLATVVPQARVQEMLP